MFRGQFVHSIDAKGRISLPARFRDTLLEGGVARFILTPALFDPCLHLHPMRAWEELEKRIAELPRFDPEVVRLKRMYVSAAVECELDRAGRVLVPQQLRDRARLEKDALWAGAGQTLELWSKELWEQAHAMTPEQEENFKRRMEQLGI
jgi:MraZ protein